MKNSHKLATRKMTNSLISAYLKNKMFILISNKELIRFDFNMIFYIESRIF